MGECPEDLEKALLLLEMQSSQEWYLTKWLCRERTMEETSPGMLLWMRSGIRRYPM